MADNDELVIDIADDVATPTTKTVTVDPEKTGHEPADDAVAGFKKQLDTLKADVEAANKRTADETRARQTAEAEAQRLRDAEASARKETVDSQIDAVANAINAATSESAAAEREYASAMEAGNFKDAAAAQKRMATAEAKLVRLGDAKFELEEAKKTPPKREQEQQPSAPGSPVDQFISTRTAPTAAWLRSHPDVAESMVRGGDLGQIATGAHAEALRKGLKPDTDEYFHLIETRLGLREEKPAQREEPDPSQRQQRKPMQSAPMSREVNGNGNGGAGPQVTLTRGEQTAATDGTVVWTKNDKLVREGKVRAGDPIGVKEYARRKHTMTQQGYYDRAAVE